MWADVVHVLRFDLPLVLDWNVKAESNNLIWTQISGLLEWPIWAETLDGGGKQANSAAPIYILVCVTWLETFMHTAVLLIIHYNSYIIVSPPE